jgi:hypothetical protein
VARGLRAESACHGPFLPHDDEKVIALQLHQPGDHSHWLERNGASLQKPPNGYINNQHGCKCRIVSESELRGQVRRVVFVAQRLM